MQRLTRVRKRYYSQNIKIANFTLGNPKAVCYCSSLIPNVLPAAVHLALPVWLRTAYLPRPLPSESATHHPKSQKNINMASIREGCFTSVKDKAYVEFAKKLGKKCYKLVLSSVAPYHRTGSE
jgi:hypothetical protein